MKMHCFLLPLLALSGCGQGGGSLSQVGAPKRSNEFDPAKILEGRRKRETTSPWGTWEAKPVVSKSTGGSLTLACPVGTPELVRKACEDQLKTQGEILAVGDINQGKARAWDIFGKRLLKLETLIQFGLDTESPEKSAQTNKRDSCFVITEHAFGPPKKLPHTVSLRLGESRAYGLMPIFPNTRITYATFYVDRKAESSVLGVPLSFQTPIALRNEKGERVLSIGDHPVEIKDVRDYRRSDSVGNAMTKAERFQATYRTTIVVKTNISEAEALLNAHFLHFSLSAVQSYVVTPDGKVEVRRLDALGSQAGFTLNSKYQGYIMETVGASPDGSETYLATNVNREQALLNFPSGLIIANGTFQNIPLSPIEP